MSSLAEQLERASPGDVISFRGRQVLGKVIGIRGTQAAPIRLVGEDETAVLVPDRSYRYAVFRPEQCVWFDFGQFRVDGEGWVERGIQLFHSEHVTGYDLAFSGNRYDGLHVVHTARSSFYRFRFDGNDGEWLRPGVGPHAVYAAEGCEELLFEDGESTWSLGAPLQVNGQDGSRPVRGVTFRRWRVRDWRDGFGVNLLGCEAVTCEDLDLETDDGEANGGVYADGDTEGIAVVRYRMVLPPGRPAFTGAISRTAGSPEPPEFETEPEEPEPPPDGSDCEEQLAAAQAQIADLEMQLSAWKEWAAQMPG